ncbi:unnamed protein product, partial [Candidula unifasciata]
CYFVLFSSSNSKTSLKFKSPVTKQFKSPLSRNNAVSSNESYADMQAQVTALKKTLQETDAEIHSLETAGYRETELQSHIEKLHEYNEIKDVGQMVLGRIAVIQGVQTKDLYERYGLKFSD